MPDEAVQALEQLRHPEESLNQTLQRFVLEKLGMYADVSTELHTSPIEDLRAQIEQLRSQIELSTPLSTNLQTSVVKDLQTQMQQLRSQVEQLEVKLPA